MSLNCPCVKTVRPRKGLAVCAWTLQSGSGGKNVTAEMDKSILGFSARGLSEVRLRITCCRRGSSDGRQ